jgi:hypothetical protein
MAADRSCCGAPNSKSALLEPEQDHRLNFLFADLANIGAVHEAEQMLRVGPLFLGTLLRADGPKATLKRRNQALRRTALRDKVNGPAL